MPTSIRHATGVFAMVYLPLAFSTEWLLTQAGLLPTAPLSDLPIELALRIEVAYAVLLFLGAFVAELVCVHRLCRPFTVPEYNHFFFSTLAIDMSFQWLFLSESLWSPHNEFVPFAIVLYAVAHTTVLILAHKAAKQIRRLLPRPPSN